MKWLNSKKNSSLFFILFFVISATSLNGQQVVSDTVYVKDTIYVDSKTKKIVEHYGYRIKENNIRSKWGKLIPSYGKMQFAGSMGLVSIGGGWSYGKNKQWETDLLFGIIPKYSTEKSKGTMTIKQNFIPWTVRLNETIHFKPFSTGLYFNTVFGHEFWGKEPGKYPNDYYNFSTRMRANIFIGQGWVYNLDISKKVFCKSITFFYELSTSELYLVSAFTNDYIKAKDILGLSLGVKLQFL